MLKHPKPLPQPLPLLLSHTCMCPLVEELPLKSTIPTHIIATEMIMRDPVVLMALKEWLNYDKIRDATDADVVDHPWYQIERPINKGKGHAVPLEPLQITDQPVALPLLALGPEVEGHRSVQVTPGASTGHSHLIAALATPAAGYMPVAKEDQCDRCMEKNLPYAVKPGSAAARSMTPTAGKITTSATPSSSRQIFDGVVIITPSWQQSGQQTSSLASQGVAISQSHLTTPSCPVTPNATPMEHMEEETAALQQQHMEMTQDLLDTCHKPANTQQALADTQTELQALCDLVKALHQCLYPLPHSSPNAPGPSHPSPISFAIMSHQAVIPTDGARILDLAPTTMVQEVTIDTGILQNLLGDMLLAPSTFLPPTHCFPCSSTSAVGEAQPPIYVSLGAAADHASGDDANDQDATNWMDID
ncbi:hypothetical protein F5J12DRAFT_782826 [Pisolithus orientalis]|uniref:uncharacterized protein n=1 Tax=Pisolithus orientalis TaxID=936130 RepID=UPI0022258DF4|nr:uncharacterized protein F5J12DRAFT_782826 [Pisolithus orientalis]KAI6006557.1 hypothetical protein F5J12DRAFT_782826 [Pisolithus orientalis]